MKPLKVPKSHLPICGGTAVSRSNGGFRLGEPTRKEMLLRQKAATAIWPKIISKKRRFGDMPTSLQHGSHLAHYITAAPRDCQQPLQQERPASAISAIQVRAVNGNSTTVARLSKATASRFLRSDARRSDHHPLARISHTNRRIGSRISEVVWPQRLYGRFEERPMPAEVVAESFDFGTVEGRHVEARSMAG